MADLFRLILLVLLLPIILIFVGPLLILAVVRGRQPMGPITLDTSRYGPIGRIGAVMLGVVLWILVWGGLAWLALSAFTPSVLVTAVPPISTVPVEPQDSPSPTPVLPTSTLVTLVELTSLPSTAIPVIATDTPDRPSATPTSLPTDTPVPPTDTPSPTVTSTPTATLTPVDTATPVEVDTIQPGNLDQGEQADLTATPTISPRATLSFNERQAVIEAVEEGNILLREAIVQDDEDDLEAMETVWQDLALQVAKSFATRIHEQYAKPLEVQFEYVQVPVIDPQSVHNEVVVSSREKWIYGGPTKIDKEEIFDFIYTLSQKDGYWIITRYTYRNILSPTLTPTLTPIPTPAVTPEA